MALIERQVFPTPPERDLVNLFRTHVRNTGQPETFSLISTTAPPIAGELLILAERIGVNVKLRPDNAFAPCPICSAESPKWKHGGTLIWCASTSAIYCIGPNCSGNIWQDRLNVARNIFRQDQKAIADALNFEALIGNVPAVIEWIDHHIPPARDISRRHKVFRTELRMVRAMLSRSLRSGFALSRSDWQDTVIGKVPGVGFLRGSWSIDRDLEAAKIILNALLHEATSDPYAWIDALPPTVRRKKLLQALKVVGNVRTSHKKLMNGAEFLSQQNFETLAKWAARGGGPDGLRIVIAGPKAEISYAEEFSRIPLNFPMPLPLPEGEYGIRRVQALDDLAA